MSDSAVSVVELMDIMGKSMGEVLDLPHEELFVTRLAAGHRARRQGEEARKAANKGKRGGP